MSEWTTGQPRSSESQYANRQPPDPAVAAVDAFRAAIVAQTALLRSLSEQVRLNQEAIVNWFSLNREQQAKVNNQLVGLAERLEKLEAQIVTYDTNQTERAVTFSGRLAAIEAKLGEIDSRTVNQWTAIELAQKAAKLASPDAERIFTPEELKKLERDFKFKPLRTTRPAPKGAARRKAKR